MTDTIIHVADELTENIVILTRAVRFIRSKYPKGLDLDKLATSGTLWRGDFPFQLEDGSRAVLVISVTVFDAPTTRYAVRNFMLPSNHMNLSTMRICLLTENGTGGLEVSGDFYPYNKREVMCRVAYDKVMASNPLPYGNEELLGEVMEFVEDYLS